MLKGKRPALSREVDDVSLDKSGVGSLDKRKLTIIVPYNELIASNLTEDDGDKHFLDLAAALSEARKIVSVKLACARVSGTGHLQVYPNEGEKFAELPTWEGYWGAEVDIKDGSQRLQYALATANDVFNLYCVGYVVEA